jgi:hypothetical protein
MASKKFKKVKIRNQQAGSAGGVKVAPGKEQETTAIIQPKRKSPEPLITGSWKLNLAVFLTLVILTLILYAGDLHLGFFSVDDPGYVLDNRWIKSVSAENIKHILTTPYFANYSPVHLFSYMLDFTIAGQDAYAFHLSSNLWAGLVAGLVFLTAMAFTRHLIISIASGVLFVVHPAHVEAVAWISSRKDLVAAAFALPSLLAYMQYRKYGSRKWYLISLLLFLFAVAGKLSVATFPAIFLAIDLFREKRPFLKSIPDKLPYLILGIIIALKVASAQPGFGNKPDPFVLLAALGQNFWLLTGFGEYVLYREPPPHTGGIFQILAVIGLIMVFGLPFFSGKRFPLAVVMFYWILFAFIPTQVLSFTHPVTDRYLFFPSVAGVILLAWIIFKLTAQWQKGGAWIFGLIIAIISGFWAKATLVYLAEWRDPRTVWFAAATKSADPVITQNLGTFYQDKANQYGDPKNNKQNKMEEEKRFVSLIWPDDERRQKLFSEWDAGQWGGPAETAFRDELRKKSLEAFQHSLNNKSNRIMPGIYYNRGLLLLNSGDVEGARKEFLATLDEVSKETVAEVKYQLTVYCHYDLGVIAIRQNNYTEALKWLKLAEEEQLKFGGNWLPTISDTRKQVENALAPQTKQQ